jgi:uncharacterized repeat protein (TIGR01451 family)
VAAFLIFAVLAAAVAALSIASAESKNAAEKEQKASASAPKTQAEPERRAAETKRLADVQDQGNLNAGPTAQTRQVPVLTMANAQELAPQCSEILNQDVLDLANTSVEDPGEIFEANRRAHPHMIQMPPPIECASELWQEARNPDRAPAVPEIINTRQYSLDSVYSMDALSASIGSNVDPSSGLEGYQGETSIAIDPNNPLHIVAHSNTFYKDPSAQCQSPTGGTANTYGTMALFGSSDGGQTWTYNCAPWPASVTGGVAGATFWFGSDPALAWDNQGRAYATYMLISQSSTASGASIVTARSSDNGATWQSLGTVTGGITSTTQGNDKEMMAIDNTSGQAFSHPGRIYVIWDAANAEKIAYSDNGSTWTTVNFASNTGAIGGNVVVGADGTVYAIWNRYNVETIVFSKSTDGGATWTAPAVIATLALQSFGSNNLPPAQDQRGVNGFGAIDIDRNPNSAYFGTLYVSFPDFPAGTTSGSDINTYVIRSTNGGTTWGTRVKVNDDNFGASQFFPWLAVDQSDGTVNVSWIDSRIDPLNRKTQAVYARSSDGGLSFEPNILVSDGGSAFRNNVNYSDENSTDNTTYNGNQYGDYTGIAALNRQVHPLWTDSRMFFPTADTQSPTRREDNATTVITNCSAPVTVNAPSVNSSTAPSVAVTWGAPAGWGVNATNGTYSVYRNTSPTFPSGAPLASGLTATSYVDTTGVTGTTYYYFVTAKNNCPGTALTPMSTSSAASAAVVFGSAGTATGVLQGTVTSGGNAVSGVVVSAGTFSATTNGSGFYQIPAINAGTYTVSSSPAGYTPASVNNVAVNDGATTVQNLSLTATAANSCFTDTTFGDFSASTGTNVEIASSPGDVKLTVASGGPNVRDQHADDNGFGSGYGFSTTSLIGQTFTPSVTASLTKVDASLWCSGCSGTNPNITLELRTASAGLPVMTAAGLLGTASLAGTSSGSPSTFSFPYSVPVTAGTQYGIVVRLAGTRTGTQAWSATSGDVYAGGRRVLCTTSTCSNPTGSNANSDLVFAEYYTSPAAYQTSGNIVSSVKDSNAVVGSTATWGTASWNANLPAGASVQLQAAGSNSSSGPFNFVGPNGTAGTFFSNGASLSQFNGFRYLKYKAVLSTTNTTNTPTLNDVTVCVSDVPNAVVATTLTAAPAAGAYGGTVNLSATLTDGANGIGGKLVAFTLSGNSVGSATTTASGVATVSNVSLSGINAGSYPTAIAASFAGDGGYTASNGSAALTVNKANTTTAVTVANATYDGATHGGSASVTGPASLSQSLTVSYSGRNSTTYGPSNTAPTNAGDYTASANYAGDSNYNASSDSKDYSIGKASQSITFGALADKTYGDADFSVSATATSGLTVSFGASGACSVSGSTVHITGGGSCTITASQGGDSNYSAATDVPQSFNIAKAATTTAVTASNATYDGNPHGGAATVTGVGGLNQGVTVSYSGRNATVYGPSTTAPTGAGDYTASATYAGDSNYASSSDSKDFQITKANQSITFGSLADKTYGDADFGVSASATSGLTVSFNASGDCSVSGSTVHITGAGSCTITASQPGDTNYNAATDVPQSFQIAKATATITLGNLSFTYDGTEKTATATTNPAGLTVNITYAPASQASRKKSVASNNPVNAGSYTVTATIDDPNYQGTASDTLVIAKADANVSVTGFTGTYDGNPHAASGTATGAQNEDLSSLLDFGSSYTNVPGGTAHWKFNDAGTNANYNSKSGDAEITISKATPTVTWSNPADIVYGTALGASQLNATASVPGSFAYTPAAGTVPASGNGQNLHVNFTPTDSTDYNVASADVSINVLSAVLSVSMSADRNPAPVGLNFNYKVTITNTGNAAATNVVVTDVLPTQVSFTQVGATQGTCSYNSATRAVTCNLGTIAAGSNGALVQITVKPREEGTLNNTASATASQWDPATGSGSASVNGLQAIKLVDLSVSKVDSVDPIFVGDNTIYTMTVKNSNTEVSATGVTLQDTLPSGMTFVSATTSQGGLVTPPVGSTGIVTADIGAMAPNAIVTVTVTAKGAAAGVQTNTATVSGNETDSNSANNTATQTTTVKPQPVVNLQKVLLASQVLTGGCQNTTGNVYLTAPAPAGGANVSLSSNVSGASVPASVFIPAGSSVSPAFNVTTTPVTAKQVGVITATSGTSSVSRGITINVGSGSCP